MNKKTPKKRVAKRRPVKPVQPPLPSYNLSHDDIKHKVEVAFEAAGRTYYRFIDDHQIPVGRYKYIYAILKEVDLRMNLETLQGYVKEMERILDGGKNKNQVSIGELWKIVLNLKSRLSLAFEPASVQRLASVLFFDETEDLRSYDRKYGQEKIDFWEKNNVLDFFLTMPIVELLGLKNISQTSLEEYIQEAQLILQDLTLDLQSPSLETSSENGKNTL
jgi:hypothetical protein